jgi:hypothetical protein
MGNKEEKLKEGKNIKVVELVIFLTNIDTRHSSL